MLLDRRAGVAHNINGQPMRLQTACLGCSPLVENVVGSDNPLMARRPYKGPPPPVVGGKDAKAGGWVGGASGRCCAVQGGSGAGSPAAAEGGVHHLHSSVCGEG